MKDLNEVCNGLHNQPVSDTPRTNAHWLDSRTQHADMEFCRQLERELNEANAKIEELRRQIMSDDGDEI